MERNEKLKPILGERKKWVPMQMKSLGKATDLIKGGGGKLSVAGGDPSEGRKPKSG
jgi:hypothetical protein